MTKLEENDGNGLGGCSGASERRLRSIKTPATRTQKMLTISKIPRAPRYSKRVLDASGSLSMGLEFCTSRILCQRFCWQAAGAAYQS